MRLMEGRTSFVIAHRLSTIHDADMVLVINERKIIERTPSVASIPEWPKSFIPSRRVSKPWSYGDP